MSSLGYRTGVLAFLFLSMAIAPDRAWARRSKSKGNQSVVQNAGASKGSAPNLILVLVIDQFRADYLMRFKSRFLPGGSASGAKPGGFQYLTSNGAYYPFGQYDILQSMTGPGHATVLTGSYPYQSGIPLNAWYDVELKDQFYCVEDRTKGSVGSAVKHAIGSSPIQLIGTTVGDELKNAGYPSRVVALALKDRAAILLGGHRADLALWFDPGKYRWVSSQYYLPEGQLPAWVNRLNDDVAKRIEQAPEWKMEGPATGFSLTDPMNVHASTRLVQGVSVDSMNMGISGIDLTEFSAERAIEELKLGQNKTPDVLAVSFSTHDYLGHEFGPNSRELEEMTVFEDKALARLFEFVQKKVPGGLKNTLIVLTGDHGIPPNPDWLVKNKIDAGRIKEHELTKAINSILNEKHGKPSSGDWITYVTEFNFYLNRDAADSKQISLSTLERDVKEYLNTVPGVAHVFSRTDYRERKLPPGVHERQILHTYFPKRSGDVIIIPKPFYMVEGDTVNHMTGYSYDRTVPIVFAGPGIQPGKYSTPAEVIDIAPTLSFLAGILPPSLSEGRVLSEALKK